MCNAPRKILPCRNDYVIGVPAWFAFYALHVPTVDQKPSVTSQWTATVTREASWGGWSGRDGRILAAHKQ